MQVTKEKISPKKALEYLGRNVNNRPIRKSVVNEYAEAMSAGEWTLNGDMIRFNENGDLIDGQHRLSACVQSGVTIETYIGRGLGHAAFDTFDKGSPRQLRDQLARQGERYYSTLAAAIKLFFALNQGQSFVKSAKVRPTQANEILDKHPRLRDSNLFACENAKCKLMQPSIVAVLHYMFARLDPVTCDQFWERIITGEGITKTMPEYWLRERLIGNLQSKAKLQKEFIVAITIKAWNFRRQGKTCKTLKWAEGEEFPQVL